MLHFEWTMKALLAGKHVLNEKPSADTAEETRQMFDLAEQKGLVLLDAYHYRYEDIYIGIALKGSIYIDYRFHPAIHRVKEILESRELGAIKNISASLQLPHASFKNDDIRFNYALGGGALMDLGCRYYFLKVIRY